MISPVVGLATSATTASHARGGTTVPIYLDLDEAEHRLDCVLAEELLVYLEDLAAPADQTGGWTLLGGAQTRPQSLRARN